MRTLVALALLMVLAGCTGAPEITAGPQTPLNPGDPQLIAPTNAPVPTPTLTPTPTPEMTTIPALEKLTCRPATAAERWLVGENAVQPEVAWTVEVGGGWKFVSGIIDLGGGMQGPFTMVSNGDRHNYTYQRGGGSDPTAPFWVRIYPVIIEDGFDAIELAERCAAAGQVVG